VNEQNPILTPISPIRWMGKGPTPRSIIYIYSEGGEQAKPHSHTHHLFAGWARGQPPGQLYIYSEGGEQAKPHSHTHHLFAGWARGQPPGQLYIYSEGGEQAKSHSHTHHLFAGWARAQPPSHLPRYLSQATSHPTKCRIYLYFLCEGGIFVIIYWLRNNATHCPKN
jgi:hypothetical protein